MSFVSLTTMHFNAFTTKRTHHSLHALGAGGVLVDDLLHQVEQVGVAQHLRRQLPDELGGLHGLRQQLLSIQMWLWFLG